MTEVSFYHLQRQSLEQVLPSLLHKILDNGLRAVVYTGSEERSRALDQFLWTYDPDSFLPHGTPAAGHAEDQPVYITHMEECPNAAQVLVMIEEVSRQYLDRFDRCLDLFNGNDDTALQEARERWKALKTEGYAVEYWQQGETGGWEKAKQD